MSDHEFEKQVHQKLQELKLRPSDGVWMEVEKSIRQGKSRRRFMWWWMAALFVGVTAGGYVMYNHVAKTTAAPTVAAVSNTKPAETSINSTKQSTTVPSVTDKTIREKENTAQQPTMAAPVVTPEVIAEEATAENKQPVTATTLAAGAANKNKKQVVVKANLVEPNKTNTNTVTLTHEKHPRANRKAARETIVITEAPVPTETTWTTVEKTQPETEPDALNSIMPVRINELDSAIATNKAATMPFTAAALQTMPLEASTNDQAVAPIQHRKPSLWHWGVVADAGYSRIAESKLFQLKGLLGNEKYYAEDLSARSNASPSANNSTNAFNGTANSQMVNWSAYTAPPKKASPIQADASFTVGLFVQRAISPRLKLSLGLGYNYLSVHTQVGQKVNSPNNPIVVNMGTSNAALVETYYKYPGSDPSQTISSATYNPGTSQKYTYRFHYLEIPLMVSWQMNKGRKLPPFQLEGGLSMAHLLSADALHYEGIKGVYYKDNDLLNKTQFNFVAGLNVGLFQQSKHPIWIGPNLRYALNGLVNKEVSTGQYAWSVGISIKMQLGKL